MAKRKSVRSIQAGAIHAMVEVARLFPNQDPIRLTAGVIDFKLPIDRVMKILRQLAPHFKGENSDMIRLAAGYNDLRKHLAAYRVPKKLIKKLKK